ncbi:type 4a pilus biogenesis protein PilO [Paenibacillus chibensis]|uniref:Type 4a pilus biogenesis protein PilO n=1 Tax=Paenibacillus chibensis TaxID=59846 RepID=A0ABU6PU37_9BACL|nr:type 4a pilus biogenesis protein PilO [Paenibacillus chibensis]
MLEKINRNRSVILLGMVALFLLAFAFYMFALKPSMDTGTARHSELSTLQEERNLLDHKLADLRSKSSSDDPEFQSAREALPLDADTQELVLQLKKIQDKSFAKLTDIEFQLQDGNQIALMTGKKPEDYSAVKEVKMKAVLEGGYNEIHEWMKELQSSPRLITIDSFSFQQPYEQRNPGSILTANISFTAYYTAAKPKS